MRIEELRHQQGKVEDWQAFGDRLSQALEDSLTVIERELSKKTGLKLGFDRDLVCICPSNRGTGCEITGRQVLRVTVAGLLAEVRAETVSCSVTQQAQGLRYRFCQVADDGPSYSVEIDRRVPAIPIRLQHYEWAHTLWWTGPNDTPKLQSAIVDALEQKDRPSEFTIERSRSVSGCALTALVALTAVLATLALVEYLA